MKITNAVIAHYFRQLADDLDALLPGDTSTVHDVMTCLSPAKLAARVEDGNEVETADLVQILNRIFGLPQRPVTNLNEMDDLCSQYASGLLTPGELIAGVQCTPYQLRAVHMHNALPMEILKKSQLGDWDSQVEVDYEAGIPIIKF